MRSFAMLFLLAAGCPKAEAPILDPVNFQSGTTDFVDANDEKAIDQAAKVLDTTDWTVLVLGLADATGDAASNKTLALARAEAVAARLRTKTQVPAKRIVVHSIGERLATGASVQERKVEFIFFEDEGLPMKDVVVNSGVLTEDFRRKARAED